MISIQTRHLRALLLVRYSLNLTLKQLVGWDVARLAEAIRQGREDCFADDLESESGMKRRHVRLNQTKAASVHY